jgi:ketosteroid isomerase-like protein
VQQNILEVQQRFWTALKTKDARLFEEILADNFIGRSPYQPNQQRAEFIKTLTSFPPTIISIEADNIEVHVFGNVAILTGVQVAHLQLPDGNQLINKIAISNVFNYADDSWLMALSHAVELS